MKNEVGEAILNMDKRIILRMPFLRRVYMFVCFCVLILFCLLTT